MIEQRLLKRIKQINWYRQEAESNPYFIYIPCVGALSWFGDNGGRIFWYCKPGYAKSYLDKDFLLELAEKYLEMEKKKPGNLDFLFKKWRVQVEIKNEKLFSTIQKLDLSKIKNQHLLRLNRQLADNYLFVWKQFYMDIYDLDAEALVEKELVEERIILTDEERTTMMSQEKLIVHQEEEKDLLKIALLIKQTPGVLKTFLYINTPSNLHRLNVYPKIRKSLEDHQRQFFWTQNSWASTKIISVFDFVEILKQILSSPRSINEEYEKLQDFEENILRQKQRIAKKHKMSPWLKHLFHFFGLLSYWRDQRKAQVQNMHHYLEVIGREIARRSRLTWEEVKICDPRGITSLPVKPGLLKKYRKFFDNNYLFLWKNGKAVHFNRKDSDTISQIIEKSIEKEVTEIRGMIACPGKVEGEVVVINKESEFYKMQAGKILVTNSTRPEFVPLMKMAAAIITDEGGITSHAAVISRELKVPCIIGTQIATKKIKDGDWVLVNANHGTVIVL